MSPALPRYLSKSRFKLALECVTKLYYTGRKKEYADQYFDDPFLKALAEGGFQVGELAKYMFCEDPVAEGITIDTLHHEESLAETERRFRVPGRVVIAEAAFLYENLFIRTDIIVKEGNVIDLYEVKAKSFEGEGEEEEDDADGKRTPFISYEGKPNERVNSKWQPYLYDLAFQKYVMTRALPEYQIRAHLLLVNKNAKTAIEGLNQKFKISRAGDKTRVEVAPGLKASDLGREILEAVPLDNVVDKIRNKYPVPTDYATGIGFEEFVNCCAAVYAEDRREFTPLGKKCKDCQFYTLPGEEKKSGFRECWKNGTGYSDELLAKPLVLEIWNGLAGSRSFPEELIPNKVFLLENIREEDLTPKSEGKRNTRKIPGLSNLARRMEQVNRVKNNITESYFDRSGLDNEIAGWTWPLHMIDFETSMVALPFHRDTKPYQGIAFQFSHHVMHQDGRVEHADQFLHFRRGVYPNIEFVQALKRSLEKDNGTIFRYHNHENTYLRMIHRQLEQGMGEVEDRERAELMDWINEITRRRKDKKSYVYGNRSMIDLYELVLRYYYPPYAKGSNSLKQILPSIIRDSGYLKERYGRNGTYGKGKPVNSLNFEDHVWIREDKGLDPYKTLPPVFDGIERATLDNLVKDFEGLADGGAALTAYNYLQFTTVPETQTQQIADALLRYCELDTLAMVMIVEGWRNWKNI